MSGKSTALALAVLCLALVSMISVVTNGQAQYPGRSARDGSWDLWGPEGATSATSDKTPSHWTLRMARHWTFMHKGIPEKYQNRKNPFTPTAAVILQGGELFKENCARCHGVRGRGDGKEGLSLRPPPALLDRLIQRPIAADEYLLWTITDGGELYGTEMPAFEDTLEREQIWKLVTYMRAGFPPDQPD
ncbi:MAG: c-type cytochrome [Rhodospirillales bacterium]|nr:c-type cytochrome [Rhodospirillales bacterium]